jgi:L-threonylcarbamoyladenylate synthase
MRRYDVRTLPPDPAAIAAAAEVVRAGGLVAFPTETVYGLGADALSGAAVARIFAAKGRPAENPVIVHVPGRAELDGVAAAVAPAAEALIARFWPGPLTLVLPRCTGVPDVVTAGRDTVAVRAPAHPVAAALLAAAGRPIAAPSANPSGRVSPTTADHVVAGLGECDAVLLDGGPCAVGIESTVVDVSGDLPVLLRPGAVPREAIEAVLGRSLAAPEVVGAGSALPAPGMLERHYAPRASVQVVPGVALGEAVQGARRPAVLTFLATVPAGAVWGRALGGDAGAAAAGLYAALHDADAAGCDAIVVEAPPAGAAWEAIRDRLRRAAAR